MKSAVPDETDDWIARLREGAEYRERAIEELRGYLCRGLSKSLAHRYGGRVQIDDVVQVALLRILAALDSFRNQSKFTTWAMTIAVRIGISELRRHYYRDVSLDLLSDEGGRIEIDSRSSHDLEDREERHKILATLERLIQERLSDRQRNVVRGALEGLSVEIIADRLNSNRNAVYKVLHDAKMRLKEGFMDCGFTADDINRII